MPRLSGGALTATGAIASIVATMAAWVALFHEAKWGGDQHCLFYGMLPAAAIFAASAAALIVVSLVAQPPAKEVVDRFFPTDAKVERATMEAAV